VLNGAPPVPMTVGPDSRRLANAGDFNADIPEGDLMPGDNTLTLHAVDGLGNASEKTVTVEYVDSVTGTLPLVIDWSTLSTPEEIQSVAQVVDGKWRLQDGELRNHSQEYDRIVAFGDQTWTDVEVTVPVTVLGSFASGYGIILRWAGHTDHPVVCGQPSCGWMPLGALLWEYQNHLEIWPNELQSTRVRTFVEYGTTYWFKARVETLSDGTSMYRLKVWRDGDPEPATWTLEAPGDPDGTARGSVALVSHVSTVRFGTVTVTELVPGANLPPAAMDDTASTTVGQSVVVPVLANDVDYDGTLDPSSVAIVQSPAAGSLVTDGATGNVTYTHTGGSAGSDMFTYTVSDTLGATSGPATVTVDIAPQPGPDTVPPVISDLSAVPVPGGMQVTWNTDEPAYGSVLYGLTAAYELGAVSGTSLEVAHQLSVSGLASDTTYHYKVLAEDASGNVSESADQTLYLPDASGGSGFVSDDFNTASLGSQWSVVDPAGDGTVSVVGAGSGEAQLTLSVPAGSSHDAWYQNGALRVMQPITNADFDLEIKFDSQPSARFQAQGLLIEEDDRNWLRFDTYHDGTNQHAFAASTSGGASSVRLKTTFNAGVERLRVVRTGDSWALSVAPPGGAYVSIGTFAHSLSAVSAGVFVGNSGNQPATTAIVDFIQSAADPIVSEDGN
ncbi:MAG: Ig-like domain-containing protein, partial [Myxococcales bacterium]|nr:Ig-like domain-containing protein [Myxococcales bacterium]